MLSLPMAQVDKCNAMTLLDKQQSFFRLGTASDLASKCLVLFVVGPFLVARLNKLQKFKAKVVDALCIPWLGCKHGFVSHHVIENVVAAFIWCLVGYP